MQSSSNDSDQVPRIPLSAYLTDLQSDGIELQFLGHFHGCDLYHIPAHRAVSVVSPGGESNTRDYRGWSGGSSWLPKGAVEKAQLFSKLLS